jgi:murein L,D-transpeptidase YafK
MNDQKDLKTSPDRMSDFYNSPIMPGGWIILFLCWGIGALYFQHQKPSKPLAPITHILVEKSKRKMTVYHDHQAINTYRIALGFQPIGPKQSQGDGKTPEGNYRIVSKNTKSRFHLSLKISYPNENDKKRAISRNVNPGNDIMIHGLGTGLGWIGKLHVFKDWTLGCIAVTNSEIEEIYAATPMGTPVEIKP